MCKRFHAEEGTPLSDEITFVVEIIIDRWAYFERPLIIGSLFSFERAFAVFALGRGWIQCRNVCSRTLKMAIKRFLEVCPHGEDCKFQILSGGDITT